MRSSIIPSPSYSGLQQFINHLQVLKSPKKSSLLERLGDFLFAAGPLLKKEQEIEAEQQRPEIGHTRLEFVLEQLRGPLAQARQNGNSFNPWTVSGIRHDEVRNTSVLAAFMRPAQCGNLARKFVFEFFSRLEPGDFKLPSERELSEAYSVSCEVCPVGDKSDRIDLLIEGKSFLIGIEVKIFAVEGERQLERYRHSLKERAKRVGTHEPVLIYLTRKRSNDVADVIAASWQDIAGAAFRIIPKKRSEWQLNHHLLHAFAKHVENF